MAQARKRTSAKSARSGKAKARKARKAAAVKPAKPKVAAKAAAARAKVAKPKAAKPAIVARAKPAPRKPVSHKPAPPKPAPPKPAPPRPAAKVAARRPARPRAAPIDTRQAMRSEYAGLKARAATIATLLDNANETLAHAIEIGPWAKLQADLEAWAAKYGVKASERTEPQGAPPSSGASPRSRYLGPCATTLTATDASGRVVADCYYKRRSLFGHNCIYTCYMLEA